MEKGDVDRNRSRVEVRQGSHDARHHLARRGFATRFAERLVINRNDDDALRRRTRASEEEAPVEGQVFNSVERRSDAVQLQSAEAGAEDERRGEKAAGQNPGRSRPLGRHSFPKTGKKRPNSGLPPRLLNRGRVSRGNVDALPLYENDILVQAAVSHANRAGEHQHRGSGFRDVHSPFRAANRCNSQRSQDLKVLPPEAWLKLNQQCAVIEADSGRERVAFLV